MAQFDDQVLKWNQSTKIWNGPVGGNVTALTDALTINVDPTKGNVFTLTPAGSDTINVVKVIPGQELTLIITTSGVTSYTLTFGTGFKSTGALATGTVSGKVFSISFISDGVNYNESARTTAM